MSRISPSLYGPPQLAFAAKGFAPLVRSSQSVATSDPSYAFPSTLCLVILLIRKTVGSLCLKGHEGPRAVIILPRGGAQTTKSPSTSVQTTSPLWPDGVNSQDIEDLVQACLQDESINLPAIPDVLEHQIYRSTIQLTLNALYKALNGIHGQTILGHAAFSVTRHSRKKWKIQDDLDVLKQGTPASEEVLAQVADRLLENQLVNQPLIPDGIERKLYVNCLKIIFRVLDLVTSTFRLSLCGHHVQLQLEPEGLSSQEYWQQAAMRRASDETPLVDMTLMKDWARAQAKTMERELDRRRWFWQRWLSPLHNELVAQLHASLYCLVLGILDDFLESTEIQILSDRIRFDLVPVDQYEEENADLITDKERDPLPSVAVVESELSNTPDEPTKAALNRISTFASGLLVGIVVREIDWDVLLKSYRFSRKSWRP